MNCLLLLIFISLFPIISSTYNPIPVGAVIISTTQSILVMKPTEYGGDNALNTIYTAVNGSTIINTIYDPTPRNLYILFVNTTNGTVYLSRLSSIEVLDPIVYQLPISYNINNLNNLTSFTSDIYNRRAFFTDQSGNVTSFSMSGLMKMTVQTPSSITTPIRSVAYNGVLNRVIVITDTTIDSCVNLDNNNLQCCQAPPKGSHLRSIAFDPTTSDSYAYVIDEQTGIYQVIIDGITGCPTALRPINTLGTYRNIQFVIDHGLYFCSGSNQNAYDNNMLIISNGTQNPRTVLVGATIVALHLSVPVTGSSLSTEETCFRGITYSDYRVAVILAAIFGTIMGIFMCFNALFCIDFFMTKRIIRSLKQQIPHNLLEDRWNKLVEEKYAKLALEKQRKRDDPPPRRKSSISGRKSSISGRKSSISDRKNSPATIDAGNDNNQANSGGGATLQVPNPIPKLSAYLRRKSESYLSRRQSDDYRSQRQQTGGDSTETGSHRARVASPQVHIESLVEEVEPSTVLRANLSQRHLLKNDEVLL